MIQTRNKQAELQALSWIATHREFVDIPVDYFWGEELKVYKLLRAQYFSAGQLEPSVIDEAMLHVLSAAEDYGTPYNVQPIIDALAKSYRLREFNNLLLKSQSELEANQDIADTIMLNMQKEITRVITSQAVDEYNHQESVHNFMKSVEEKVTSPKVDKIAGVRIGIPKIDNTINGFQHGLTYIVGGLKKTGKSRFAINAVSKFLEQGLGGIVFSMEMPIDKIHACVVANRARIDTTNINNGNLSPEAMQKFSMTAGKYLNENLYISKQSAISPDIVRSRVRAQRVKSKVDFVVVDYIQRMRISGMESRTKEVERCALDLADIGRDEDLIMIILSQISGEYDKMRDKAGLAIYAFFKESQAIVESADAVIALDDPNRGQENDETLDYKNLKSIILQRDGKSDIFCALQARLQYAQFEEIQTMPQPTPAARWNHSQDF